MSILIVGLGNPGKEYDTTRHNAGFLAVDAFAARLDAHWKHDAQSQADVAECNVDGTKVILAKPTTFMNRSGEAVASLVGRYKLASHEVWAVYDDAALDVRQVRTRVGGSAGGHNGVTSIIDHIGDTFARFRIGIGAAPENVPLEDYVLQKFSKSEMTLLKEKISIVNDMLTSALREGVHEHTVTIPE